MNESIESPRSSKKPRSIHTFFRIIGWIFFLALIATVAILGYLYYQTKQEIRFLTTQEGQEELAQREIDSVMKQLSKLTILPEEEPVIATIIDPDFLATQSAFYEKSEAGDKIVIFSEAQKAYIYSPNRNIIVNSGPLIVEPEQGTETTGQGTSSEQSAATRIRLEIRNGTEIPGEATQLAQSLDTTEYQVTTVSDSEIKNYQSTQIILLDQNVTSQDVASLVQATGGTVSRQIPDGEPASGAQVLVIIGN